MRSTIIYENITNRKLRFRIVVTMAVFEPIINSVRLSNLNFSYQETPYFIYLTIRKTQVKNNIHAGSFQTNGSQENVLRDKEVLEKENMSLKHCMCELKESLEISYDTTNILEEKIAASEAEAIMVLEELKKRLSPRKMRR